MQQFWLILTFNAKPVRVYFTYSFGFPSAYITLGPIIQRYTWQKQDTEVRAQAA